MVGFRNSHFIALNEALAPCSTKKSILAPLSLLVAPTSPMASSHHFLQLPLFTALLVLLGTHLVTSYDTSILKSICAATSATCYPSIFSFGDSLADTGNLLHYVGGDAGPLAHLPYGETYFHHATGRFSDGRLVIDFIDCRGITSKSLFLVGEIGWNDHSHSFEQGRTADEIRTFIPKIVEVISSVIDDLIKLGARTVVVPGIFPSGCVSVYLTAMQSDDVEDYDPETGCIKWVNEFAAYHNHLLQNELDRIRRLYPQVAIIYADYYEALMSIFRSPQKFGFKKAPLDACCGGGGPYNVNFSLICGGPMTTVCSEPSKYVFWDGTHLTDAASEIIARGLLEGPYAYPPIIQTGSKIE